MIKIKNKCAIDKMKESGKRLAALFGQLSFVVREGVDTHSIDEWIGKKLLEYGMVSQTKGYRGYRHVSCISVNDEVVHGVPCKERVLTTGDLVKIDICAAYDGYCADMARPFFVNSPSSVMGEHLVNVAQQSLLNGIAQARVGNKLHDISAAIQKEAERNGFGVIRDFAGHGIGRAMHEDPIVPNYGKAGTGITLQHGMAFAIEPMITVGGYRVKIDKNDGWTVRTADGSLATHIEDTVLVLDEGPYVTTQIA